MLLQLKFDQMQKKMYSKKVNKSELYELEAQLQEIKQGDMHVNNTT